MTDIPHDVDLAVIAVPAEEVGDVVDDCVAKGVKGIESDVVVEALLRQSGVIRTRTLEELFDVASLLAHQPILPAAASRS